MPYLKQVSVGAWVLAGDAGSALLRREFVRSRAEPSRARGLLLTQKIT